MIDLSVKELLAYQLFVSDPKWKIKSIEYLNVIPQKKWKKKRAGNKLRNV